MFECGFDKIETENGIIYKKTDSTSEEFVSVQRKYEDAGYVKKALNSMCDAEFVTYVNDIETINISYKNKCNTLRVVAEKGENLPKCCYDNKNVDVLVTQLKTTYFSYDCGMGYVIRLSDGRFVVIDGGMAEYDEPEQFFKTLNSQNVRDTLPVIAVWFITHPHCDHFNMFIKAVSEYRDKFILENVVYNFSDKKYSCDESDLTDFNKAVAQLAEGKVKTARTGQKYVFGNDYFEIMLCADDMYPTYLSVNETSLVIKGMLNGKSILWLADAQKAESSVIVNEYDEKYLKSDIMQVAHHGYWGGSDELHRMIDPRYLLWPSPDYWYIEKIKLDINEYLRTSSKIKETFIADREETVLNMSQEDFSFKGQEKYNNLKCGEYIVFEDFKLKSIYSTGFRCIWGGGTGFEAVKAEFCDDGVKLTSLNEEAYTFLEIASPWQTENSQSLCIELFVEIKGADKFGLMYNNPSPTVYCEEKIISLPTTSGYFNICLKADADLKKSELHINSDLAYSEEYIPKELRGVYLVLKNAELIIKNIKITKGV